MLVYTCSLIVYTHTHHILYYTYVRTYHILTVLSKLPVTIRVPVVSKSSETISAV